MERWAIYFTGIVLLSVALLSARLFAQAVGAGDLQGTAAPVEANSSDLGPIESARQLFTALGMTDDQFARFKTGGSLSPELAEPILQALHALSQFPAAKIHRWTKRDVSVAQLEADGDQHRGELFHVAGRLVDVGVFEVPDQLAERFEISIVRRCDVAIDGGGRAVLLTQFIPKDLQQGDAISFDGALLAAYESTDNQPPELVFAAQRLAWHPATDLGKLRMDVGLLDHVAQNRPIFGEEAAGFYQLLAAVGRASLDQLLAATRGQQWTVIPAKADQPQIAETLRKLRAKNPNLRYYFALEPEKYVGNLMAFEGQVYRCVEVKIPSRELAARLGFDHYYDLQVFIDLDYQLDLGQLDPETRAKEIAAGRRPVPTEVTTFPIAACVRELPPGFPMGVQLRERVRVPGYFFKQWTFHSAAAESLHPRLPARSPLIIGPGFEWLSRPRHADSKVQFIIGGGIAALLALLCLVLWVTSRRDRKFREQYLMKNQAAIPGDPFNESTIKPAADGRLSS
ncbi:MAG: hypothetical protein IT427_01275 [Pirellulales bacterium]|nr:hypothetical protein [Pirellulales bacterium]